MDEAAKRKERLRALREAAELSQQSLENGEAQAAEDASMGRQQNGETADGEAAGEEENLEVRFRNYLPRDQQLTEAKLPPPPRPKFEDPTVPNPADAAITEDPITSIAPKKPNWDLRRDVAKKLEKLERRTQRAMIDLMHEEEKRRQIEQGAMDEGEEEAVEM